ncbi:hypothetical protein ACWA1C_12975 [Flectobacillus roseus]
MIEFTTDYIDYFSKIGKIVNGEKIRISATHFEIRKIVQSTIFFAFPYQDSSGKVVTNVWLLTVKKPLIGIIAQSNIDFERFIDSYLFSDKMLDCYKLISTLSDANSKRFDSILLASDESRSLYNKCRPLIKPLL